MVKLIIKFLLPLLVHSTVSPMQSPAKKICIGDNQKPNAYLNLGHYFLGDDETVPHIPLAVEAFEKAVTQEEDLEVRARAALELGKLYYFTMGSLSDNESMDRYLSIAGSAACQLPHLKEIVKISQLLRQPKPLDWAQVNHRGESPLHYAAKKGYLHMLRILFTLGAQVILEKEVNQQTALYLACCNGRIPAIEYLLAQGAQTDTRDQMGRSLLHATVSYNQKEALLLLLSRGLVASAHCHCDDNGLTAFYLAVRQGRHELAALLLSKKEYDAYIDETDSDGRTCLHWASLEGDLPTVRFLVQHGAGVQRCTVYNNTPLHYAAMGDHEEVFRFLTQHGADPSAKNKAGQTPTKYSSLLQEHRKAEELSPSI